MHVPSPLDVIALEPHRQVVAELLAEAQSRPEVVGVLLIGSLARGNPVPGSDVDVLLLLDDGQSVERPTQHDERQGVWVELHYRDMAWAVAQLDHTPEWLYSYTESRILHDPRGDLARLIAVAHDRLTAYRTPAVEKERLRFIVERQLEKLAAALAADDLERAATIVGFGAYAFLSFLCAAYDHPPVGPTNVWLQLPNVPGLPPELHQQARALILGTAPERVEATHAICAAIIAHIDATAAPLA